MIITIILVLFITIYTIIREKAHKEEMLDVIDKLTLSLKSVNAEEYKELQQDDTNEQIEDQGDELVDIDQIPPESLLKALQE